MTRRKNKHMVTSFKNDDCSRSIAMETMAKLMSTKAAAQATHYHKPSRFPPISSVIARMFVSICFTLFESTLGRRSDTNASCT